MAFSPDGRTLARAEIAVEAGHEDFVCIHPGTRRRRRRVRAWKRLRRIAAEAGLPPERVRRMSPHKLRHTRAYHTLEEGSSMSQVQGLLDHESLATTTVCTRADERARLSAIHKFRGSELKFC